ncbi:MAG: pilin [Candidatus Methylumidiphilus sp.]
MKGAGSVAAPIGGKTYTIVPSTAGGGSLNWRCVPGTGATGVLAKYLPKSCS